MHLPDFTPPSLLARLGPQLPQTPWSLTLALSLNTARKLGKLPADLAFMEGKTLCLCVSDLGISASLRFSRGCFHATRGAADVRFSASLNDLMKLIRRQEDPDTLFFQRRLKIEGDTELGLTLKNLLDQIELPSWLTTWLAKRK